MVRFTRFIGDITTHPTWKYVIASATTVVLFTVSTYIASSTTRRSARRRRARRCSGPTTSSTSRRRRSPTSFGGVDTLDDLRRRRQERRQRRRRADPAHGGVRALDDGEHRPRRSRFGRALHAAYWGQNHYGDPKWGFIPVDSGTVRAALFQLRQNGAPGFLRPFMTDDGRYANLSFFYRDHKGETRSRCREATRPTRSSSGTRSAR